MATRPISVTHGGQGLNVSLQDAINLGWRLAAMIRGKAPASLLDTYENERRPIGERLFVNTLAQVAQVALVSWLDTREYPCFAGMDAALIRPVGYFASVGRRAQP